MQEKFSTFAKFFATLDVAHSSLNPKWFKRDRYLDKSSAAKIIKKVRKCSDVTVSCIQLELDPNFLLLLGCIRCKTGDPPTVIVKANSNKILKTQTCRMHLKLTGKMNLTQRSWYERQEIHPLWSSVSEETYGSVVKWRNEPCRALHNCGAECTSTLWDPIFRNLNLPKLSIEKFLGLTVEGHTGKVKNLWESTKNKEWKWKVIAFPWVHDQVQISRAH